MASQSMIALFLVLLIFQGALIIIDEIFFHQKRGLPKWEIWGHPLDTFFLILPLISLVTAESQGIYIGLSAFSCLFVTKDEWIHAKFCSGTENWLHAVLFLVHPLVFISAWYAHIENSQIILWALPGPFLFLVYQIFYWNFYAHRTVAVRSQTH
jgi:hypothetical protein